MWTQIPWVGEMGLRTTKNISEYIKGWFALDSIRNIINEKKAVSGNLQCRKNGK